MNARPISKIRKFLNGIALAGMILSLCFGMRGSHTVHAQNAITTIKTGNYKIPSELMTAIKNKLIDISKLSGGATSFGVGYYEEHHSWAWINLSVANGDFYNPDEIGPTYIFFGARINTKWDVAFSGNNTEYITLLDSISRVDLSPDDIRLLDDYYYLNQKNPEPDVLASAGSLLFPWSNTQNPWKVGSLGIHNSGFSGFGEESGAKAVDFIPQISASTTARVIAMESGYIIKKYECTWNTMLILRHDGYPNTKTFLYMHIQNGTSVGQGASVTRGQYLGDLRTPVFNAYCSEFGSNCEIDNNPATGNLCSKSNARHIHLGIGTDTSIVIDGNVVSNLVTSNIYNSTNIEGGINCPGPSLNSPADGYISSSQTIDFSWSPPSGCTFEGYTFRIKDTSNMDSGGNTIVDTGNSLTTRTRTIGSEWNNRDLYWGVRTANPLSPNWSVRKFRIEPPTPPSCTNGAIPGALQSGYQICAEEGAVCNFSGQATVAFGASNCFTYEYVPTSISCDTNNFPDPIIGIHKACYFRKAGDANGDGRVDALDIVAWLSHYSQITTNGPDDGDFNTDGVVSGIDIVVWLKNFTGSGSALSLPAVSSINTQASAAPDKLAQEQNVRIFFAPNAITMPPDTTFSLKIDANSYQIGFARIDLAFDPSLIQLTGEIQTTDLFGYKISKTDQTTANSTGQISIILSLNPGDPPPTSVFEIAQLPFRVLTSCPQHTTIFVRKANVEIVNYVSITDLPTISESAEITLNPMPQECEVYLPYIASKILSP